MLKIDNIGVVYQTKEADVRAIERIAFEAARGEFVSVVGPSGCGKSTLLQCLTGLRRPTTGTVWLEGKSVDRPPEGMAVVLQEYGRSLFPWLTVEANVALPLEKQKTTRKQRMSAVAEALDRVGLHDAAKQYPWQLSGGMQQRVAIARALVVKPRLLIMDEPYASVDAQTRIDLEDLLLSLWTDADMTVIFVTHDIDEAVYLSDRVLVLSGRPSTVKSEVEIPLARPRDQVRTKSEDEYISKRTNILEQIRGTKSKSDAQDERALVLSSDPTH